MQGLSGLFVRLIKARWTISNRIQCTNLLPSHTTQKRWIALGRGYYRIWGMSSFGPYILTRFNGFVKNFPWTIKYLPEGSCIIPSIWNGIDLWIIVITPLAWELNEAANTWPGPSISYLHKSLGIKCVSWRKTILDWSCFNLDITCLILERVCSPLQFQETNLTPILSVIFFYIVR